MNDNSDEELTLPWNAMAEWDGVAGRFSVDPTMVSFSRSLDRDGWYVPLGEIKRVILGDSESDSLLIQLDDDVIVVRFKEHDDQPLSFVLLTALLQEAGTTGGDDPDDPYQLVGIACSVCGARFDTLRGATWGGYPNLVCGECSSKAVNLNGEPATPGGDFDHGDNPVFIHEIKCWRRYHFGGCVTMRDVYDCDTLDEFWERHVGDRP